MRQRPHDNLCSVGNDLLALPEMLSFGGIKPDVT